MIVAGLCKVEDDFDEWLLKLKHFRSTHLVSLQNTGGLLIFRVN